MTRMVVEMIEMANNGDHESFEHNEFETQDISVTEREYSKIQSEEYLIHIFLTMLRDGGTFSFWKYRFKYFEIYRWYTPETK